MAGTGRRPSVLLERDGAERCARHALDRIFAAGGRCQVWLTGESGVVVRRAADTTRGAGQLQRLVGEFTVRTPLAEIKAALEACIGWRAELPQSAAVVFIHAMRGTSPLLGFPPTEFQEAA